MNSGYSPIPSRNFLRELEDRDFRNDFVADHLRARVALLIRALREERGWSQAELGRRLGKPQSVVSRLEDPDYGKVTLQTLFELAAAFDLPLYIDLPNWEEWFHLMEDMSRANFRRKGFDVAYLIEASKASRQESSTLDVPIDPIPAQTMEVAPPSSPRTTTASVYGGEEAATIDIFASDARGKTTLVHIARQGRRQHRSSEFGRMSIGSDELELAERPQNGRSATLSFAMAV
jgi:transcriptional regulator with XRE-family HTH domain